MEKTGGHANCSSIDHKNIEFFQNIDRNDFDDIDKNKIITKNKKKNF